MMEKEHTPTNMELRSEEVQELMGRIPPAILRIGISAVLVFVVLVYVASNVVMYPDIVSFPAVAKNVDYVSEIKVEKPGVLVESSMIHGYVCRGDTLARMLADGADGHDTVSLVSPRSGMAYPCDVVMKYSYVESGSVLCVVADSIRAKISAKAFVTLDMKKNITEGMAVESSVEGKALTGKVTSVADYANPNSGTYVVLIEFETPKELKNTIVWNVRTDAKIKITERSVFDKFFKERIVPTF